MDKQRYVVPAGGGFFLDVPGIWQGGEVLEVDPESGEVSVLSGPSSADEEAAASAPASEEAAAQSTAAEDAAAARPQTSTRGSKAAP